MNNFLAITAFLKLRSSAFVKMLDLLEYHSFRIFIILILLFFPLTLDIYSLSLLAKYLCLSFPAVGIVLFWGYGGILSLGQGIFFGIGGYLMAMFLKLEAATSSEASSSNALASYFGSTGLPDFMVWNGIEKLPWFWKCSQSMPMTIVLIIVLPFLVSFLLSYLNFRKSISGVYFTIVTLALSGIVSIVIIGQQGYTGGINGITDFRTFDGVDLDTVQSKYVMYFITCGLLICTVFFGRFIILSRAGNVLRAIRDEDDSLRFLGYDTPLFKSVIFSIGSVFASIGGAMFTIQTGLASPSLIGIATSIEMVIYAAIGGRLSLVGAVYGSVIVNGAKTYFSGNFVEYWTYFIGFIYLFVVLYLPFGLASLSSRFKASLQNRRLKK